MYVARACLDTCVLAEQDGTTKISPPPPRVLFFYLDHFRRSAELDAKQLFIRTMEKKAVDWGRAA